MTIIYKYQFKCNTENILKTVLRDSIEEAPTLCPTNSAHSIDNATLKVIATFDQTVQSMKLHQTSVSDPENHANCFRKMSIPVVNAVQISKLVFSLNYPIDMIGGALMYPAETGDLLSIWITAKTDPALGTVSNAALSTDTVLNVSQSLIDAPGIRPGCFIGFTRNDFTDLSEICNIDPIAKTITLENELGTARNLNDPIYVRWPLAISVEMIQGKRFDIDTKDLLARVLATSAQLNFEYKHKTTPTAAGVQHGFLGYRY